MVKSIVKSSGMMAPFRALRGLSWINIMLFLILLLVSCMVSFVRSAADGSSGSNNVTFSIEEAASLNELKKSSAGFVDYLETQQGANRNVAKGERKKNRVIAAQQQMKQVFGDWQPMPGSANHTPGASEVIFTTALSPTYGCVTAKNFAGTARAVGFKGDIIVAVLPKSRPHFIDCLKENNVIIYQAELKCEGHDVFQKCFLESLPHVIAPVNLFRYYFYTYWSSFYSAESVIMLADSRDVFFQSNPFAYRKDEWYPPVADLVMFEEFFPIKTVGRDMYLMSYVQDCYGKDVVTNMLSNSVITAGLMLGSRDGIVTYVSIHICSLSVPVV
jgi:hypothetical protein